MRLISSVFLFLLDASLVRGITTDGISLLSKKSMRMFLETFAKNKKLDPLLPATWYKLKDNVLMDKVLSQTSL